MKVPCVIFYGLTQMTVVDGEYRLEEPGTLLAKIFQKHSITITALRWWLGHINWSWKDIIGHRIGTL